MNAAARPTDRPTILLAMPVQSALQTALAARYEVLGPFAAPFPAGVHELDSASAARVRALVTMGTVGASAGAMDRLPRLELVACIGSGYEQVDVDAARARGVVVTHGASSNADSVADVALGLLIASVRRFPQGRALLDSGGWKGNAVRGVQHGPGLLGMRVGIYGLGAIGARVARRVAACGAIVGYHGRAAHADVGYEWFSTLAGLADWADALVVTVRAAAANRHAVNADILRALGADGHVVNVARGSVVDEAALVDALARGRLAGAGLDVFEHEPYVPAALLALPNAALTPHLGGATHEAQAAMRDLLLRNLAAHFAGEPVLTPVTLDDARH